MQISRPTKYASVVIKFSNEIQQSCASLSPLSFSFICFVGNYSHMIQTVRARAQSLESSIEAPIGRMQVT